METTLMNGRNNNNFLFNSSGDDEDVENFIDALGTNLLVKITSWFNSGKEEYLHPRLHISTTTVSNIQLRTWGGYVLRIPFLKNVLFLLIAMN